ncbi:hypothetical protein GQ42DRAFT_73930 [Ramicandelaber brevisporus]|nr:hypothetical protein GQ42DRAFT_73930 [Ramicandelaber brevisporus]
MLSSPHPHMFDFGSDIEMVDGTPSPSASPAFIDTCITNAIDYCTIAITASTTSSHDHDFVFAHTPCISASTSTSTPASTSTSTSTSASTSATISTSTSAFLSVPAPSAAFLDDSSSRETLDSPSHSPAGHNPQPEQQSARSAEDTGQEYISHAHIESLFRCEQMPDTEWKSNISLVLEYIFKHHPTDSAFASTVRSLVDTSLSVLRTYSATPQPRQPSDAVPSFLHAFCMEAAPHLLSFLKHSALLQGVSPQSALFQSVSSQVQQFIQLLFCISQRSQTDRAIVNSSNAIYNIAKYFPDDAPAMMFSSLSLFSISNSDHVLGTMYILSDLVDLEHVSEKISPSQCATASQWTRAALSMELDHDEDHTVEIIKCLYWTSHRQYAINVGGSNRTVHLQPIRDFIAKHLKRSVDIPIVLAYYVKLAKLNFEYAYALLDQVLAELKRDITCWNRYSAVTDKLDVISDIMCLIRKSTRSDEHPQLKRLQKILKSDAVPFVVPTGCFKNGHLAHKPWTSVYIPGTNIYKIILRKAAQLLANPWRDYTPEVSQFISRDKHTTDVFQAVYSIARDHHYHETPLPVQLIPPAINAISSPEISPAAKKIVSQFLGSNLHNLSLEPIAGASVDLDLRAVTSQRGIDSILEYKLSPALPDAILAAISHKLKAGSGTSRKTRMSTRALMVSLDQFGEALARVYHRQHPPTEISDFPQVHNELMEDYVREYTYRVIEQRRPDADNDIEMVVDGLGGGNGGDGGNGDTDAWMDMTTNRVRSVAVNARMNNTMYDRSIREFAADLADEMYVAHQQQEDDEGLEMGNEVNDADDDTIIRDDVHDHLLFIKADRINQFLSSAPTVPEDISWLFQRLLINYSDTLLSDRSLCQMVLEFRPDIWGDLTSPFIPPHQTSFFMLILRLSIRIRQHLRNPAEYFLSWSNLLASVCTDNVANGVYELMRDYRHAYVGGEQDAQFYFNVRRYAIMFESHDFAGDVAMAPSPREAVENLKELAAAIDSNGIFGRGGEWHEVDPAKLLAHWENEVNPVKLHVAMAMRFCATLDYAFQQG